MPDLYDYFGDEIATASPINHVRSECPPILTLTGADDVLTPAADMERFHAVLEAAGVKNRLVVFPGAGHSFDFHPKQFERCLSMVIDFVEETVGVPAPAAG